MATLRISIVADAQGEQRLSATLQAIINYSRICSGIVNLAT
jgi:hypothetical protein